MHPTDMHDRGSKRLLADIAAAPDPTPTLACPFVARRCQWEGPSESGEWRVKAPNGADYPAKGETAEEAILNVKLFLAKIEANKDRDALLARVAALEAERDRLRGALESAAIRFDSAAATLRSVRDMALVAANVQGYADDARAAIDAKGGG